MCVVNYIIAVFVYNVQISWFATVILDYDNVEKKTTHEKSSHEKSLHEKSLHEKSPHAKSRH